VMKKELLEKIYCRTSGKCHLCHKKLVLKNYGTIGSRGSWEIDHSVPRSKGGTDHRNNLYAACISCNRSKGNRNNSSVRSRNGVIKAPMSATQRKKAVRVNTVSSMVAGACTGFKLFGPIGGVIGGAAGAFVGSELKVKDS